MKSVVQDRYEGPEHLRIADIAIPEPGKAQIRVRVLACAVNLSDWEYVVAVRGGFAEHACVPATSMARVPDSLCDEIAACLPQAGGIAVAGTEGVGQGAIGC